VSARNRAVALGVAWRGLHRFFHDPTMVVPSMMFPLFFFAAFAGGLSNVANVPGFDFPENYTTFQFVFVLIQASAFGGVFTGFAIARDFVSGVWGVVALAYGAALGMLLFFFVWALRGLAKAEAAGG
jgi:ABC-2 type transport system permease protein